MKTPTQKQIARTVGGCAKQKGFGVLFGSCILHLYLGQSEDFVHFWRKLRKKRTIAHAGVLVKTHANKRDTDDSMPDPSAPGRDSLFLH